MHSSIMEAVHDSVICVSCGCFGSFDLRMRVECRELYLIATVLWLKRPEESFGRDSRGVANIMHAGAKLKVDSRRDVMMRLLDEASRMS